MTGHGDTMPNCPETGRFPDIFQRDRLKAQALPGRTQQFMKVPPWLVIARAEMGVCVHPVGSSHPRIGEYHEHAGISGYDDKVSWCSSFINWSLAQVGITGTGSALARSWLDWGQPLEEPVLGCVTVLWREEPASWKGHVGYYLHHDAENVHLLGGNQLEQVREHFYPRATILAHRWPIGVPITT
jgi:uncharacterized protein (TIGR02594 family)